MNEQWLSLGVCLDPQSGMPLIYVPLMVTQMQCVHTNVFIDWNG